MWFTTISAKERLLRWVDALDPFDRVYQIYPEEIALFLLGAPDEVQRCMVVTLLDAVEYKAKERKTGEEKLSLELYFFASNLNRENMAHPGDFLYPVLDEEIMTSSQAIGYGRRTGAALSSMDL